MYLIQQGHLVSHGAGMYRRWLHRQKGVKQTQYGVWTDTIRIIHGQTIWSMDRQTDTIRSMDTGQTNGHKMEYGQTNTIWTLSIGQTKRNNADRRTDTTQSQNLYQEYIDAFWTSSHQSTGTTSLEVIHRQVKLGMNWNENIDAEKFEQIFL